MYLIFKKKLLLVKVYLFLNYITMAMEELRTLVEELKEEWIFVEIKEETNEEVGRVLATRCTCCGSKCGACAWCKWPEFSETKHEREAA